MNFTALRLRALLDAYLPSRAAGLVVALSGGGDSAALLAACAQLGERALRAVHVDHGLQPAAAELRSAAAALAARCALPFTVLEVRIGTGATIGATAGATAGAATGAGESLEAAARAARYAALGADLAANECLLTAHTLEDQAETLLLQALRGAGLKGLAAMPACRALGLGWHVRPLLGVGRHALLEFGAAAGAPGMLDPMNLDPRFDRNHLRRRIWPSVMERWPGAGTALARTAAHAAAAQSLLEAIAAEDLAVLADGEALSVTRLRRLPAARQVNALRSWIGARTHAPLPSARLAEGLRQLLEAAPDHQPAILWKAWGLRRYRDRIMLGAAVPPRLHGEHRWRIGADAVLELGANLGRLRLVALRGGWRPERLPDELHVQPRQGGEMLQPAQHAATQSVQHLCQFLGILPWMRDALPFVYAGEKLIGVADHWRDAAWCAAPDAAGLGCVWEDAPEHM